MSEDKSKKSNVEALQEYYDLHKHAIYLFVYALCENKADAEEATAKAFAALWKNQLDLKTPADVGAYLYEAALDAVIAIQQRKVRESTIQKAMTMLSGQPLNATNLQILDAELLTPLMKEGILLTEWQRNAVQQAYSKRLGKNELTILLGIGLQAVLTVCYLGLHKLGIAI